MIRGDFCVLVNRLRLHVKVRVLKTAFGRDSVFQCLIVLIRIASITYVDIPEITREDGNASLLSWLSLPTWTSVDIALRIVGLEQL